MTLNQFEATLIMLGFKYSKLREFLRGDTRITVFSKHCLIQNPNMKYIYRPYKEALNVIIENDLR